MRLDKFIAQQLGVSRAIAGREIRGSRVTVDGDIVKDSSFKLLPEHDVEYDGNTLVQQTGPRYFMLNKPQGYVCSTDDPDHPTVLYFLDVPVAHKLHAAGRLDIDTTGLVLMTDDGQWSHRVTSPRHECAKTYHVWLADPIAPETAELFAEGILLRSERDKTRPAKLELLGECEARLTIHEGKYHQVKRMFAAVGNKVIGLHREQVGDLVLDEALAPGEYRELTAEEIAAF